MGTGLWDENEKNTLYFIIQMSCHKQLYSYLALWWRLAPERVSHEETNINQSKKTKSSVVKFGLVKAADYCAKPFQRCVKRCSDSSVVQ